MSKSGFILLLRTPIRLVITVLSVIIGISHNPNFAASASNEEPLQSAPTNMIVDTCGGDGGDGGDYDYCNNTNLCTSFCPCGPGGDSGGDCYYGFNSGSAWCGGGRL